MASLILSYGFKKPQNGDTGVTFWDDLAFDIQRTNDHNHDGVTSTLLTSTSVTAVSHSVDDTVHASDITQGWVLQASGEYKRQIAIANFFSALRFVSTFISWRKFTSNVGGVDLYDYIYPTIEQVDASTYNVTLNDISTKFLAVYAS